MKSRVIIESPFGHAPDAGTARADRPTFAENVAYLHAALRDSLMRGEAPFASHALYPLVLEDASPPQRVMGMEAGFAWGDVAHFAAVYVDLGWTPGMREGAKRWTQRGMRVVERRIDGWQQ